MSKKIIMKTKKPLNPKPAAKQADTAFAVDQEDLDGQQGRLRQAAAAGTGALKTPGTGSDD